jgi:hypothetical protein
LIEGRFRGRWPVHRPYRHLVSTPEKSEEVVGLLGRESGFGGLGGFQVAVSGIFIIVVIEMGNQRGPNRFVVNHYFFIESLLAEGFKPKANSGLS